MKAEALIGNHYKIGNRETDRIGRGGMGDVYRAIDTRTQEPVAIKHLKAEVLALDENTVERFEREGEALRRLNHPNIVKVLASVEELGDHYIVMEYVAGGSLSERLAQSGPMPVDDVLKIALELADALTRAHHLNIIHRDIKPANVLIAEDGTPRLTDFGVAHIGDLARITQTGMLTGTYAYVSPEACDGSMLDGRTDIWSFGVVLYEMLAGRRPFDENNLTATITAILSKPVPDLTQFRHDVPESLTNLIYRMLEKDRKRRIGSVRLVGAQLEAIMSGLDTGAIELEGSRFDTTASTLAPSIGPRHNLPPQPTPFVGREPEVLDVVNLLNETDCRLLTLMGPGGMGKTRLAIEVASRKVDDFKHGVRFVGLAAVSEVELLVTAVAQALNFSFPERHNPKEQLLTYLREKEMLLVMDNFEHLIEGVDLVSARRGSCGPDRRSRRTESDGSRHRRPGPIGTDACPAPTSARDDPSWSRDGW
jgi:non-specific serine/threonine protein kinase